MFASLPSPLEPADAAMSSDARERRAHQRHLTTLRVAKLVAEDRQTLVIVRNVSSGGMMIDLCAIYAATPVDVGGQITISLDDVDALRGTILWRNGTSFGCRFDRAIDVGTLISRQARSPDGKVRRKPRVLAQAPVTITGESGAFATTLCDISQDGLKVPADSRLVAGQKLNIAIADLGSFAARVQWTSRAFAGIVFTTGPLLRELMSWLARQPALECSGAAEQDKSSAA